MVQGILCELLEAPAKLRSSPTLQMTGGVILGEGPPFCPRPRLPGGHEDTVLAECQRTKWAQQKAGAPDPRQILRQTQGTSRFQECIFWILTFHFLEQKIPEKRWARVEALLEQTALSGALGARITLICSPIAPGRKQQEHSRRPGRVYTSSAPVRSSTEKMMGQPQG